LVIGIWCLELGALFLLFLRSYYSYLLLGIWNFLLLLLPFYFLLLPL
jgi:hypothetical protein